jgi:hypothetical protein
VSLYSAAFGALPKVTKCSITVHKLLCQILAFAHNVRHSLFAVMHHDEGRQLWIGVLLQTPIWLGRVAKLSRLMSSILPG